MEFENNFAEVVKAWEKFLSPRDIEELMAETAQFVEDTSKEIINTFVDEDGHPQGVDSGSFRDGIKHEITDSGWGFRAYDSVPHGIYHEFGTQSHWVPFFDKSGNLTSLGQWAMRHFDELGYEVIGKSGRAKKKKSRNDRESVLRRKGGIKVKLSEMAPFRTSLDLSVKEFERLIKERVNK